jgi:hypothetical protein
LVRACPQRIISQIFTSAAPAAIVKVIGNESMILSSRCSNAVLTAKSRLAKRGKIGISRPSSAAPGCLSADSGFACQRRHSSLKLQKH